MAVNGVGDDPGPKPASTAAGEKKNTPAYDPKKALEALQKAVRAARAKAAQSQAESQTPQVADSAAFRSGAVPVNQTKAGAAEAAKGPAQVQANANTGTQPPPGQEASKARSAAAPIEDVRRGIGGGIIDQTYAAIDKADKRVTSGIDSVRSDTPGVSQAASVFRGVAGFVKDLGFGAARAAVMTSPTGQADTLFKDAELGAKVVNGEVTGQQAVDTAKAVGGAIVEPVTKPWNRGDRVEAGTRAVTEVGSLFLPASKAGLFGRAANVADKADVVAKGTRLAETTKGEAAVSAGAKAEVPAAAEAGGADKVAKPATVDAYKANPASKAAAAAEKAKPEGPTPKVDPKSTRVPEGDTGTRKSEGAPRTPLPKTGNAGRAAGPLAGGAENAPATRIFSRGAGGVAKLSLEEAAAAAERHGIDMRMFKLEYEQGPHYGFISQTLSGKPWRAPDGRIVLTLQDKGLESAQAAVETISHELNHLRGILSTGHPTEEVVAELAAIAARPHIK